MKRLSKRIFNLARIYAAYKTKKIYCGFSPSRLWIEVTNYCNLKCVMCLNKDLPVDSFGYMDFALYKTLIDEIAGRVYDVYLHHRGESLLHPKLFQMISYAKEKGLSTRLHTNATLLDKEKSSRLIDSGLDFISFSFDGYDKQTYESIRIGARFEKTLSNILDFLRIKEAKGSKKPITAFTIIEFSNQPITAAVKRNFLKQFKPLALDSLRIRQAHNWGGDYNSGKDDIGFMAGFNRCTFLWYSLTILWDGTVLPCPQDFFAQLKLGNLKENSLMELWNSKKEMLLREKMNKRDYLNIKPCNRCDRLWRPNFFGIPLKGLAAFLRDNVMGYKKNNRREKIREDGKKGKKKQKDNK